MDNIPNKSLFFAPMEGVTDPNYRIAVMEAFPEWNYFATDFLRVPTNGKLSNKQLIEHFGKNIYLDEKLKNKTIYQILTVEKGQTTTIVNQLDDLDFPWIDLNIGCPSKRVNTHGGGAYLLSDLIALRKIIKSIRENFSKKFTAKIRVGYRDDSNFKEILNVLEGEGVEAVTVHARTRDQLYKGIANWKYIKEAVEICNIPVIGNGDLWTLEDIDKIFKETQCHSIMMARGALKTPWMAKLYQTKQLQDLDFRKAQTNLYFNKLEDQFRNDEQSEEFILKRFKAFSRYIFDDYPQGETLKTNCMRSKSLNEFKDFLH
jgi:tRNA-dihydrouridine synthase B